MIYIKDCNLQSYTTDGNILTWEINPTIETLSEYSMEIYRSESPGVSGLTDYVLIASGISTDNFSYVDTSVKGLYDHLRIWYYKFKVIHTDTGKYTIQPDYPDTPYYSRLDIPDFVGDEIIRRKRLILTEKSGRDFFLIKRRTWGTHCTYSWDPILMKDTNPDCTYCYGTGWLGGYYSPIKILGMIQDSPQYNQIQMFGEWKPSDVMLFTLNWPKLNSKDILIDHDGKRWMIIQVRTTDKRGKLLLQSAQLGLIGVDDKIYNLPINVLELEK